MSTFRPIALTVLAILVAACGYYWMSVARQAPQPPPPQSVLAVITDLGSVQIGGEVYVDSTKLRAKIAELRKQNRNIDVQIRATKDMNFETMGRGIKLLQDAGVEKIGFITEPRNPPDDK